MQIQAYTCGGDPSNLTQVERQLRVISAAQNCNELSISSEVSELLCIYNSWSCHNKPDDHAKSVELVSHHICGTTNCGLI